MNGLSVYLTTILVIIIAVILIVVLLLVQLVRHITRTKKNADKIQHHVDEASTTFSAVSTVVSIIGVLKKKEKTTARKKR